MSVPTESKNQAIGIKQEPLFAEESGNSLRFSIEICRFIMGQVADYHEYRRLYEMLELRDLISDNIAVLRLTKSSNEDFQPFNLTKNVISISQVEIKGDIQEPGFDISGIFENISEEKIKVLREVTPRIRLLVVQLEVTKSSVMLDVIASLRNHPLFNSFSGFHKSHKVHIEIIGNDPSLFHNVALEKKSGYYGNRGYEHYAIHPQALQCHFGPFFRLNYPLIAPTDGVFKYSEPGCECSISCVLPYDKRDLEKICQVCDPKDNCIGCDFSLDIVIPSDQTNLESNFLLTQNLVFKNNFEDIVQEFKEELQSFNDQENSEFGPRALQEAEKFTNDNIPFKETSTILWMKQWHKSWDINNKLSMDTLKSVASTNFNNLRYDSKLLTVKYGDNIKTVPKHIKLYYKILEFLLQQESSNINSVRFRVIHTERNKDINLGMDRITNDVIDKYLEETVKRATQKY